MQVRNNMAGINNNGYIITNNVIPFGAWICPAGITEIVVTPCSSLGVSEGASRTIRVIPNTTYNITINSGSYVINNANTFGSLYSWTGSSYIELTWVE